MDRSTTRLGSGTARLALFLAACALLFRILVPAGWMPQAGAAGITLNWCNEVQGHAGQAEARAMLAEATGKHKAPEHKPAPEQPCAFAAAAQALACVDGVFLPPPHTVHVAVPVSPLPIYPGRGLAAPPPLSTGPPSLA